MNTEQGLRGSKIPFGWGVAIMLLALMVALAWVSPPAQAQASTDPGTTDTTTTPTTSTTVPAWGTLDVTLYKDGKYDNNTNPAGIYSDGEKLWVADNGTLEGVFVYDLESGEYEENLAGTRRTWSVPRIWNYRGLWSDGNRMITNSSLYVYSFSYPGLSDGIVTMVIEIGRASCRERV